MMNCMQEVTRQVHQQAEDRECTFRPATGNAVGVLAASGHAPQLNETKEEFVERLAGDGARKQMVLQAIDNMHMRQYSFRPNINERSRAVRHSACPLIHPS
jgi:hypothetical protein